MESKTIKKRMIEILLAISLILLLFTVASCNNPSPQFPDFISQPEEDANAINSVISNVVNIDFYIQATPSMRGFVAGDIARYANIYTQIIEILENFPPLWTADKREVSYYRFDISGIDIQSSWPFYRITRSEFQRDTLTGTFYSLDWILNNAIYGRLYENLFGTDTGIGIFREPFIENTIRGIQNEHLSIIVTDLLDFNLGTGIVNALTEKISNGASLVLIALESPYIGQHQIPGTTMRAGGDGYRPFYLLILGPREYVSMYSSHLISRISDQGIVVEPLYIIQGTPNIVINSGLSQAGEPTAMERITGGDLTRIIGEAYANPENVFMYSILRGRNDASVSFNLPLSIDIDMVINPESTRRVLTGNRHGEAISNAFGGGYFISNFLLERLDISTDEMLHSQNIGTYSIISEIDTRTFLRLETGESGFAFGERTGDASITLVIEGANLRSRYSSLSSRYRLTVELSYLLETLSRPAWVAEHNGSIGDLGMSKTPNLNTMITDIINAGERNRETSRVVSKTRLYLILR